MRQRTMRRAGFTLVELMVAMALTIFIMVILTQAFVISIDTFSGLKAIGDMQENLRAGANALRYDLAQNHFEGKRRTSDPLIASPVPREGFLRVYQGANSTYEGIDSDGVPSWLANFAGNRHVLHLTSRLRGNQPQSFFSAIVNDPNWAANKTPNFFTDKLFYNLDPAVDANTPADATLDSGPPVFRTQWAEIAYFLWPTGTTEAPNNPNAVIGPLTPTTMPLYGLYRAQFAMVTDNTAVNADMAGRLPPLNNTGFFPGMACVASPNKNGSLTFLTPNNVALGTRTFNPATYNLGTDPQLQAASTLVVPNVVSFQVQGIVTSGSVVGVAPQDLIYDTAAAAPGPNAAAATTPPGTFGGYFTLAPNNINPGRNKIVIPGVFNGLVAGMKVVQLGGIDPQTTVVSVALDSNNFVPPSTVVTLSRPVLFSFNPNRPVTFTGANVPLQGLSITIRVWDNKTRQTRQMTLVLDL